MIKQASLIVFFLFFVLCLKAQTNLVIDGSFEDATASQGGGYFWFSLNKWKNPNNLTPEYYSDLNNGVRPSYHFIMYQPPKQGSGIVAIVAIQENYPNTAREYVQGSFTSPLQAGKKYEVKFYASLGNYWGIAVSHLGAYLSTEPITFTYRCELEPQIESDVILQDSTNWMEIKGEYIAQGGEKHITLGNFRDDKQSDTIKIALPCCTTGGELTSVYFLDDVSVVCLDCPIDEVGVGIVEQKQNPKNVIFNTSTNTLNVSEGGLLVIYNMQGAKVLEQTIKQEENIALPILPKGVYVWQLQTEKEVQQGKFVVNE